VRIHQLEGPRNLGSATEPSVPTSSSPRGRGGVSGRSVLSGRAPYPKGSLDLGHQRNMGFISPTLKKVTKNVHQHPGGGKMSRRIEETHHSTKLALRVFPPVPSSVRVRERGFEPSSDTIWVASPQRVPESCPPPRGCGGDGGTTAAGREKRHDSVFG